MTLSRMSSSDTKCSLPGCNARAVHRHHVVYEQELRKRKLPLRASENLMPLCNYCHRRHHDGSAWRILVAHLPTSVFAWAAEMMGPGPAYEYLARRYHSSDSRLEELRVEADAA